MNRLNLKPEPAMVKNRSVPWLKAAAFAVAYFACAEASNWLSVRQDAFMTFWLPAGLYVAVLLLNPTRDWLWLCLAAFPANFTFDLIHGTEVIPIFIFYSANTLQSVAGAWLVRRFVAERPTMATLKEFIGLMGFAALFSTMLGAVVTAAMLVHFGLSGSFEQSWKGVWGDCAMAVLVFTPFLLTWFSKRDGTRSIPWPPKKIAEAAALLLAVAVFEWFLLARGHGILSMNRSWAIPLLLWAGLRFGVRGATTATLFFSLSMACLTTQFGLGLSEAQMATHEYVFPMEVILAMASLVALIPAIVVGERDRTLAKLSESEEKFSKAFKASPDGICITELASGRFLEVNEGYCRLFQYTREELIGHTPVELGVFESPDTRKHFVDALLARGSVRDMELPTRRRDGQSRLILASAERMELGTQPCIVSVIHDITDRKHAEEALRDSEQRFRSYFELAAVGCVISSPEKGIFVVNDQFCQMLGYPPDELKKMTWVQLTHPDDITADLSLFNRVLAKEIDSYTMDKRYLHKDGHEVFITLSVRCVRRPDGTPDYFVGLVMDITERKRAEREREEAVAREQAARAEYTLQLIASQEAERTRIAAELHDSLGQNLLLIKNHAQLALKPKTTAAAARAQLEEISALAAQAIAEVRQISHDLHPYQLDHLGLTRALEAMIDSAAQASGMQFERKLDSADEIFSPDAATNLYRIAQETVNNILKHSGARHMRIELECDVREVRLRIEDDGRGFPATENADAGKGLGLKNIAERTRILNGTLNVDSAPGRGTRIVVTVPIVEAG